jgi:ABC-type dipeptide/oligopeptide/nickel transport system permease subunit
MSEAAIKKQQKMRKESKHTSHAGSALYIWKKIRQNPLALTSVIIIGLMILLSILSPFILPNDFSTISMQNMYALPSLEHPFGCDEVGRDILARILYGARYTLGVGFLSVFLSAIFGIAMGAAAGYFGGVVDQIVMRFLDIMAAFPQLLLAIAISAVLGTGFDKCIYALGISGIPHFARMMRANILTIRNQEFVEAATSIKCSKLRIIIKHIIPNAFAPLIVEISMSIAGAGLAASSLSFIGLGVQPPAPEWGAMLASARNYIRLYPHMIMFPGIFIMLSVLSFNMIGDAIRDALDPKLKD